MPPVRVDFITNQAPHYRAALWKKLIDDDGLDPCFLFGEGSGKSIREIDFDDPCWRGRRERFWRVRNVYLRGVLIWQRGTLRRVFKTDAEALVLLGQMYVVSMWLVAFIARRRGIRVLFWGHGAYGREGGIKRWFRKALPRTRRIWCWYMAIMPGDCWYRRAWIRNVSGWSIIRLITPNRQDFGRRILIQSSISREGWFKAPLAPLLLFVGRLTRQKSLDRLISAVASLGSKDGPFNLLFVGDGAERGQLRGTGSRPCRASSLLRSVLQRRGAGSYYHKFRSMRLAGRGGIDRDPRPELRNTRVHTR